MKSLTNNLFKIAHIFDRVAGWAITLTMVVVVLNVVLRIFNMPISGTYEWVGFLTAIAVVLSLAYCEVQEGHIAITFFIDKLSRRSRRIVDIFTNILVLMFLIMTSVETISYANTMAINREIAQTTKVPIYPFIYIIAIGFIAFSVIVLIKTINIVRKGDYK